MLPNLQALSSIGGGLCSAVRYIDGADAIALAQREFDMLPGDVIQLFADTHQWASARSPKNTRSIVVVDRVVKACIDAGDVRIIPRSVLSVSGEIRVCADRVLLLSYADGPVAIEIRSQVIADVCRATLELAWHTAGRIEEWVR